MSKGDVLDGLNLLLQDASGKDKDEILEAISKLSADPNETARIISKIKTLVKDGKIYEYAGRCWFTSYMTWTKLKKKEKEQVKLIEGEANGNLHYWLEVNGEVVDPHYMLIDSDVYVEDWYEYVKQKEIDLFNVKVDKEDPEIKYACNWLGKTKFAKVYHIDVD
jgi:hypothetical protein